MYSAIEVFPKCTQAFFKVKNKESFQHEHAVEIAKFESARSWLNSHVKNDSLPSRGIINTAPGTIPNLKELKAALAVLINDQKTLRGHYKHAREQFNEIDVIRKNIDTILSDRNISGIDAGIKI